MLLGSVVLIFSCNQQPAQQAEKKQSPLEKVSWLAGRWENKSPEGNASEIWVRENDSTYRGESYFVIGNDTVSRENIELIERAGKVYYIPVMQDQNGGKPVRFTLTSSSNDFLLFENPEHDFPQKISYKFLGKDKAIAEISGVLEGKEASQQFPMQRVN